MRKILELILILILTAGLSWILVGYIKWNWKAWSWEAWERAVTLGWFMAFLVMRYREKGQ